MSRSTCPPNPCREHGCHACCVGTRMTLTLLDVARLEAAGKRGFYRVNRRGDLQLINRAGSCIFLEDGLCSVYSSRPDGCRSYPLVVDLDRSVVVLHDFCEYAREFEATEADRKSLLASVEQEEAEAARRRRRRRAGPVALLLALTAGLVAAASPRPEPPPLPWETWSDLATLAVIPEADRVLMRSSYCPDGCEFDRHDEADSRFLRIDGEEGVIFEADGAGAVTRIWMTQGEGGRSLPLDPEIWIRVVVDGEIVVQLPLPDFFGGGVAPFTAPLVGHRTASGGGNVSYVPIPYRSSCRISLLGADRAKIWFQVTYHEIGEPSRVAPFTGEEDLDRWRELLATPAGDPWRGGPWPTTTGEVSLRRGNRVVIAAFEGPDILNGLLIRTDRRHWSELSIRLAFDDAVTVDLPLEDLFAVGAAEETPTRSVLVGAGDGGGLYCYFPMPFFERAVVQLSRSRRGGPRKVPVAYAVRRLGRAPLPGSGVFRTERSVSSPTLVGVGHPVFAVRGRGRWVGLFAELGSMDDGSRDYLEGDERVYLDGGPEPVLHGTGVEDFFGGGFYFRGNGARPEVFRRALHGMTYDRQDRDGAWTTGMYRLMITDAPTWSEGARVVLESGPVNRTPMRALSVAYLYLDSSRRSADREHQEADGAEQDEDDGGGQANIP